MFCLTLKGICHFFTSAKSNLDTEEGVNNNIFVMNMNITSPSVLKLTIIRTDKAVFIYMSNVSLHFNNYE